MCMFSCICIFITVSVIIDAFRTLILEIDIRNSTITSVSKSVEIKGESKLLGVEGRRGEVCRFK